jgi:large subunit ribosomal protein L27
MSHKKAGGSTRLGRDSQAQRLGVKIHDGQKTLAGMVLVRQRGSRFHAGPNVKHGGDDTLYAKIAGIVKITEKKRKRFDGSMAYAKYIQVVAA